MKQIGNRIVFDQDGEIIFQTGEMQGDVLDRKVITKLDFIDLEYGFANYDTDYIESIDVDNKIPIVKKRDIKPSDETLKIQELEKQNADLIYQLMLGEK